ncbi:MAG: DNA helicase RecQ [Bacteroidetes bacterium]|nr:DNA helicase RecQ [Bacteroidota bacterium]
MTTKLKETLKKYFGFDSFRENQERIVQSVLEGKDVLALMPTGGGKSVCYQLPALVMPGTTIVVSPLISLMKDQVSGLHTNGISAAFLNSSLTSENTAQVEKDFISGSLKLLYVSPEKLISSSFFSLLQKGNINLFAIDEAHCISSWGHDFRPEYTKLGFIKDYFPSVPIIALTATADKITRRDINDQLKLKQTETYLSSFDRPNIHLEVRPALDRFNQILSFIKSKNGQSGIIYCLSRKTTETLAAKLNAKGIKAAPYHAGLSSKERSDIQDAFTFDQTPIICATLAFGMGIDKSSIRWVIHYNIPKNIESYYQEIGRAGRDGASAIALLFYGFADIGLLRDIINDSKGEKMELQLAKLNRMKEYAEALICRRKILLGYFGEYLPDNCENCDVCLNPPNYFNATRLAQMALSAITRLNEKVTLAILIDVLRGSHRKEITENGYHLIKTFGVGRDYPSEQWYYYITQWINMGFIEIAYDAGNVLRLGSGSKEVLFENKEVQLVKMLTIAQRKERESIKESATEKKTKQFDDLYAILIQVRLNLSRSVGIPPYQIFPDSALIEMARKKPISPSDFLEITGVSEAKALNYGQTFLSSIRAFLEGHTNNHPGISHLLTYHRILEGMELEDISRIRKLTLATIEGHVLKLYVDNHPINIYPYLSKQEIEMMLAEPSVHKKEVYLNDLFEKWNGAFSYFQIKLLLAYLKKIKN